MTKPLVLYRFFDAADTLLYIGITNSPHTRFNNHRSDKYWFKHVVRSTMEHFTTRAELEIAEVTAIQTEKPKHNVAHSVAPGPKQIAVKPRIVFLRSDANNFPAPDRISGETSEKAEHEARLDELELRVARRAVLIPHRPCPSCDLIILTREYDGLIKCLNCLNMWTSEELESA